MCNRPNNTTNCRVCATTARGGVVSDLATRLGDYESGDMDWDDTVTLFSDLVASGYAWHLQGSYGRMAASLIESGVLDSTGEIVGVL